MKWILLHIQCTLERSGPSSDVTYWTTSTSGLSGRAYYSKLPYMEISCCSWVKVGWTNQQRTISQIGHSTLVISHLNHYATSNQDEGLTTASSCKSSEGTRHSRPASSQGLSIHHTALSSITRDFGGCQACLAKGKQVDIGGEDLVFAFA